MDYDDMPLYAARILRSRPALCQDWRQRFSRINIDEAQDLSPAQQQVAEDAHHPGHPPVPGPDLGVLGVLAIPNKQPDQKLCQQNHSLQGYLFYHYTVFFRRNQVLSATEAPFPDTP